MDIINRINSTRFLGCEFLTWLWFRSATQEGIFAIGDDTFEVWFDRKMTLATDTEAMTIKAENPSETSESRVSALTGKIVSVATLRVVQGQKQWTVTVKGETLGLSSVKIPALLSREDDDLLWERLALIDEIEDMIRALFGQFIAIRTGNEWSDELDAIRKWIHRTEVR